MKETELPRKEWPTISARVAPEEVELIDAAAYRTRQKRSQLIHDAVMERVRSILGRTAAA